MTKCKRKLLLNPWIHVWMDGYGYEISSNNASKNFTGELPRKSVRIPDRISTKILYLPEFLHKILQNCLHHSGCVSRNLLMISASEESKDTSRNSCYNSFKSVCENLSKNAFRYYSKDYSMDPSSNSSGDIINL